MRDPKSLPPVQPFCILLAGDRVPRLHEVTREECKLAIAFGGGRLVDFTISNAFSSGLRLMLAATQYLLQELVHHPGRI